MRRSAPLSTLPALLLALVAAAPPTDPPAPPGPEAPKTEPKSEIGEERSRVTRHTLELGGRRLAYTATAGTLLLQDEDGSKKAQVFYVAYTLDGADPAKRPVTFSFNGGPGSSSVWLHLGIFGPKRVEMDAEGRALPPPYRLVDNESSILDRTDLVFIDPVTTGFSRAVPGEDPKQFHGVEEDVRSVGDFIRLWTTRFGRWGSPKLLAGESYGTTRAAGLAGYLQERHGLYLSGIVLVSAVLNTQTQDFHPGNDLPYLLHLPTYTAAAWYHRRLEPELQRDLRATLDRAERFALGDYATALMQGDALAPSEHERIAAELARLTGLRREYVEGSNLRIEIIRFTKELLRDVRRTVGRLDARFTGIDLDAVGEEFEYDPSYAAIQGPYTATLNDYLRRDLGFESDLPYEILTSRVRPWSYGEFQNRYLDVAETLRGAMTRNPALRVFIASGYYDFATPYFATDYTLAHMGLPPELRDHVSVHYYEAGHMMYIHEPSRHALKEALDGFYAIAAEP